MEIQEFIKSVLSQDEVSLKKFFCKDAVIKWHCTNEKFSLEEYIRANCKYPGNWEGELERIEEWGNKIILVLRVFLADQSKSFHVVSFITMKGDKIIEMDEYWSEDGEAPQWRKSMEIGTPIVECKKGKR